MSGEATSLVEFLESEVQPALFDKLDVAFPEFGWKRTARFGARPDRIVCNRPFGFLIHGRGPVTWTEFVHGCKPRGREFADAVRALAERCGVAMPADLRPRAAAGPPETSQVLEAVAQAAGRRLEAPTASSQAARRYLARRGLPLEAARAGGLGLLPETEDELLGELAGSLGLSQSAVRADLESLGLLDPRWAARLFGPWRGANGAAQALFGRRLDGGSGPKYLNSRGRRPPFYGLPLSVSPTNLILVEGPFDALALRASGFENTMAAGGATVSADALSSLRTLGCRDLTVWLDADAAGQAGLLRAAEIVLEAPNDSPRVSVVDPLAVSLLLGNSRGAGDPNEILQRHGRRGVLGLLAARLPARLFAALEDPEGHGPLDQVLVETNLGSSDLDRLLKNGRDLPEIACEIRRSLDESCERLERALVWAHGLMRADAAPARVVDLLRQELESPQESSPA